MTMNSLNLSTVSQGRSNNFNLLRFLAATVVIFSHSYGLTGNGRAEPLLALAGLSLGSLAVDIFFVSSGFLIAKSWISRNDVVGFFFARLMRIYPALWVSILACGLVLGPAFTRLSLHDYFFHIDTLKFFLENGTLLIAGTFKYLPGVFTDLPASDVNLPLWTLPYELKMYICLAVLGSLGILKHPRVIIIFIACSYVGFCAAWLHFFEASERVTDTLRFVYFFFFGSAFYLFRDRIRIGWPSLLICILSAILLSSFFISPIHRRLVLAAFCPPLVLMIAFVPKGRILLFNRLGDYSYGIYIYSMPVQQSIIALFGTDSVLMNFAATYLVTLPLAIASWTFLERKALAYSFAALPFRLRKLERFDSR